MNPEARLELPVLQTERLRLRNLTLDDAPFILKLVNTPAWLKYIGDRGIKTLQEAKNYILAGPIHNYMTKGYGFQLVELKENQLPIGLCGLVKRDHLEHEDLGFAFLPEFEGKGYAFEAATATVQYANFTLNINRLLAITTKDNFRSIQLLKRLNFEDSGEVKFPNEQEPLFLFKLNCK